VLTVLGLWKTDNVFCLAWADANAHETEKTSRIVDLDVDIGADAVDYKYAFHHRHHHHRMFEIFFDNLTTLF